MELDIGVAQVRGSPARTLNEAVGMQIRDGNLFPFLHMWGVWALRSPLGDDSLESLKQHSCDCRGPSP